MSTKLITVFNRSPAKMGDTYLFIIPKTMIDNKIIDPDKFYEIQVREFDDSK